MSEISLERAEQIVLRAKAIRKRRQKQQGARDSLLDFIVASNPYYQVNWHHAAICDRLTKLKHETGKKIMIFVAPQRGKSEIVSRNFPAWWLGNFPSSKNILSSYSGELANSFNIDCQAIMKEPLYNGIFPKNIPGARQTQNEYQTSKKGFLYSVGVGGSTTGKSAGEITGSIENSPGLFICDDPVKDLKDAFSKTKRKTNMDWWRSVVKTRVHRTSHTILMHTRWHSEDVAGQLLKDGADGWEVLSFPEIGPDKDFPNEYDKRGPDDPLWPNEKGDYNELMELKKEVGSYVWSALFLQKPVVEGGNIIKEEWINLYEHLPFDLTQIKSHQIIQSWDLQFKATGTSFTVGLTLVKWDADFYLVDIYRKRADIIDTRTAVIAMDNAWPQCHTVLIEDKANGPAILSLLKKVVTGLIPVKPTSSKDERLHAVAPIFEAGNFYLPANHPLTTVIIDELVTFPASQNDDIVDAISQALNHFSTLKGLRALRAYSKR